MSFRDDDELGGGILKWPGKTSTRVVTSAVADVEAYWDRVRAGRLVPSRSEIDPSGLRSHLAHVFVVERIASGLARVRIAGRHLTELMGLEVRGMPVSALFEPASRDELGDAMQALFDDPAKLRFELEASGGFGRPAITGQMMLLPLRSDLGEVSRALGVVQMTGKIGRPPRRFEIARQTHQGLVGFAGPEAAPLRGFSELDDQTRPKGHAPAPARRGETAGLRPSKVPYLQLVSDSDS